ncbi:MAG TPA: hypothetical protein PLP75_13570 [Burkholderiales bacterium]|nr:hypothetical protein [Burkholderiales bacterium]
MKKNILLCAILGLTLTACNPSESNSIGDDGNVTTTGNGGYPVQESGMVLKSSGQKSTQAVTSVVSLLQMGVKAAASSLGTSVGKGVLNSFLGDPNQKMYDRFDQVDKKLADIDKNLKEQLKLSNDTLNLLSSLILDQDKEWLNTKLTAIHTGLKPIGERDTKFETGKIYGDLNSTDLDKIYNYVQTHKDYQTLVDAGIVNANLIDPEGAKNKQGLTYDTDSTKDLYNKFQDEFIKNVNNAGNTVNSFKNTKTNLLAKLTELGLLDGKDMIGYINAYNYNIMDIRLQMVAALQKLYNMQLVQLAYYYGVKGNLDFQFTSSDPTNPMPAQNQGLTGFKKAAQMLFNAYEADLNNLNKVSETYLPFITETDVVMQINYDWFGFQQLLLSDKTFLRSIDESAPLPISDRQCEVTSLTFNSIGDSPNKYGLVNLGINCYLGNETWKPTNVVFPAVKDGTKIVRYAYHTIYATSSQKLSIGSFSTATKQLTSADIKAFAEQTSSKDSIKDGNINGLVDGVGTSPRWVKNPTDKKDMVLFSPAGYGSGGFDWVAGDFELKDNGNQTTRILGVEYYDGNKGDNPAHLRRSQVYRPYLMNGEMIYNVRFGKEVAVKDGRYNGRHENPVTFFYNLASYRNHWFAIKMSMGYDSNKRAVQALGVGCIDSTCHRVSNTTLKWGSGAEVKLIPPSILNNNGVDAANKNDEYQTLISGTGN